MLENQALQRVQSILTYWFGSVEDTLIPSEHRAKIWFSENEDVDLEIKSQFDLDLRHAMLGHYGDWERNPRSQLALIITLDQFSRHIYRGKPIAFQQDDYALNICQRGMEREFDHELSLIERVFYYFPLLHAEHLAHQKNALQAYEMLAELALPETKVIYESFFKFASHHYSIISRFGRFPQRNSILNRESTPEELDYLKEANP